MNIKNYIGKAIKISKDHGKSWQIMDCLDIFRHMPYVLIVSDCDNPDKQYYMSINPKHVTNVEIINIPNT